MLQLTHFTRHRYDFFIEGALGEVPLALVDAEGSLAVVDCVLIRTRNNPSWTILRVEDMLSTNIAHFEWQSAYRDTLSAPSDQRKNATGGWNQLTR